VGDRAAECARRAGDECYFAVEVEVDRHGVVKVRKQNKSAGVTPTYGFRLPFQLGLLFRVNIHEDANYARTDDSDQVTSQTDVYREVTVEYHPYHEC
jgi:hypothetical protein